MSALMWNAAVPAGQYPEHSWPRIVRHGNVTPSSPSSLARAAARSIVEWRQHRASRAASGATYVSTGSVYVSMSQNVWPL